MKFNNIFELRKAYTEGVYADTPANRKLGRVGMSYDNYKNKENKKDFEIQNDDNVLNLKVKNKNGEKLGEIKCIKDEDSKIYYLEEIFINKDFRGKGIGKDLMNKFIEEAKKDKSYKKIELQVEAEDSYKYSNIDEQEKIKKLNHNLVKNFYSKFGFDYQLKEDKNELSPILELKLK